MACTRLVQHAAFALVLTLLCVAQAAAAGYSQVNLVSDGTVPGTVTDANLVNPWGMAATPTSPLWVSDNGTGVSTLYNGNTGQPVPLVVTIPPVPGSPAGTISNPTGQVFNGSSSFELSPGSPARFIFATEGGTIAAWNGGTNAQIKADNSASGAVYKGLALATTGGNSFLYAANFRQGRIDVFDGLFSATTLSGSFTDPNLPSGYGPFNVQELGGQLYVAYAQVGPGPDFDEVAGPGLGIVDAYDFNGNLLRRVVTGGNLNAPWGLALAPTDFAELSNALLVGNFGDGRISAYDPVSGTALGQLSDANGQPIAIDGLWALRFGNNGSGGPANGLFFTAGIDNEQHGLFGKLVPVPEPATLASWSLLIAVGVAVGWWRRARRIA